MPHPSRRWHLGGGEAAAAALAAGGFLLWPRTAPNSPPADVAPLMQQAWLAIRQATREGHNQAIGLYQRVVPIEPD